jgi:class 3 adenylate cyclase
MGRLVSKRFDEPDEVISQSRLSGQILVFGETHIGRYSHAPGWSWSGDVKPLVGTLSCQFHHLGMVVSGRLRVMSDEGAERVFGPGDAFDVSPGHDAAVVGDEPCVTLDFLSARDWARPTTAGDRVLVTLLLTDIVGSTAMAARLGDAAWKQLLARHYERVRLELDRFRGYEVNTTGDGILAMFDGTERAVRCAAAVGAAARQDGLEIRAGLHSGEVERSIDNVRGVTVHVAARIMALAGPGEVLLSSATVALLEGTDLAVIDAGEHEFKGLEGRRRVYRLAS